MSKRRIARRRFAKKKSFFGILFKYILYSGLCGMAVISCILLYFTKDLPDLKNLKTEVRSPSVVMQTYDGNIIGSYGDLYEDVVRVEDLPKHVPAAFMAVEDKRFLQHFGIDFIGFFRAAYQNYVSGRVVQGGSTITQQLAKNILISEGLVTHYDRSLSRKIRELLMAVWLEHKFSKKEIMMMYLNRVYFGAGTFGIDAASRKYFNKSAKDLSVFEAAILAGLLKAPTKYSPSNHPDFASERAAVVLETMQAQGFIKSAKEIIATQAKAAISNDSKAQSGYMYFCDFAYEQAKKILGEIEDDIIIVTTFDEHKQKAAEESVNFHIKTESENYKFSQSAFICLGRDGAVQAMVGGKNYSLTQFNRATQAIRMPGSAFKLFVYGAALEHGYQLVDMISDAPFTSVNWNPKNYKYKPQGSISILDAFTKSVNSVSIRLAHTIGLKKVSEFAGRLGIDGVSVNDLSVALGTTPVILKDLVAAYTSFMDGLPIWPYCILEIRTKSGDILYQHNKERKKPIIDEDLLTSCRTLLRSVVQRGSGRVVNLNDFIFGKTGTNGDSDAWFIGFHDPQKKEEGFSFGAWVGNDKDSDKMAAHSTGSRIPARISKMFIEKVLSQESKETTTDEHKLPKNYVEKNLKIEKRNGLDDLLDKASSKKKEISESEIEIAEEATNYASEREAQETNNFADTLNR